MRRLLPLLAMFCLACSDATEPTENRDECRFQGWDVYSCAHIEGAATDSAGRALSGVFISATELNPNALSAVSQTGLSGRFVLKPTRKTPSRTNPDTGTFRILAGGNQFRTTDTAVVLIHFSKATEVPVPITVNFTLVPNSND